MPRCIGSARLLNHLIDCPLIRIPLITVAPVFLCNLPLLFGRILPIGKTGKLRIFVDLHPEFDDHDWGAVIIKFWVQIDKDTQLARFTDRQNTPEKQWKITEEDWRNRDKWDAYEGAVNEMIQKTSTTYAPWHILESVDKKYARIKALRIVIAELEKVLD